MENGNGPENSSASFRSSVGDHVKVLMPGHRHPYIVTVTRIVPVTYADRCWEPYTPEFVRENWNRLRFNFDERKGDPRRIPGICRHTGGRYWELKVGTRVDDPAGTRLEIQFSNGDKWVVESWLVVSKVAEESVQSFSSKDDDETLADEDQQEKPKEKLIPQAKLHDADETPINGDSEKKGANLRKREKKLALRTTKGAAQAAKERREELVGAEA